MKNVCLIIVVILLFILCLFKYSPSKSPFYMCNPFLLSRVENQHEHGYCGCCFSVASMQMVMDRRNRIVPSQDVYRSIDMQALVDMTTACGQKKKRLDLIRPTAEWNACFGGDPELIMWAMKEGHLEIPVMKEPKEGGPTKAPSAYRQHEGIDPGIKSVQRLEGSIDSLKKRIVDYGPIVARVASSSLLVNPENGESEIGNKDHVVCIVGWSPSSWIIRNSWGKKGLTRKRPDETCILGQCKLADTVHLKWKSVYGYAYLPFDHPDMFWDALL